MFKIITENFEDKFYCEGNLILKYKINYPQIKNNSCCFFKFNSYNYKIALNLKKYIEDNLLQEAQNLYEYNKAYGYPIMTYEIIQNFNITYNENNIISLYYEQYIYSGGAHGITTIKGQTWNMKYSKLMSLSDFYPCNDYYILYLLKQINYEISKNPENYFDNYCNLVLETFKPQNFYITSSNTLCLFFNEYDIAPHSTGIPTFCMNY